MKKKINFLLLLFCTFLIYAQSQPIQKNQSKPVQKGHQHSDEPINVMGFTYKSTPTEVKEQLEEWGFVWKKLDQKKGFAFQIEDIDWYGVNFDVINFCFDSNGVIKWIYLSPDNSENKDSIMKGFKKILSGLPYRKQLTRNWGLYDITTNYSLYNGKDETEFAVIDNNGKYINLSFYLNNSFTEYTGLNP